MNFDSPPEAPRTARSLRTVTVSPGANGASGTHIAAVPSELHRTVPECGPERDPETPTVPRDVGVTGRNVMFVRGDAATVPGGGNMFTVPLASTAAGLGVGSGDGIPHAGEASIATPTVVTASTTNTTKRAPARFTIRCVLPTLAREALCWSEHTRK